MRFGYSGIGLASRSRHLCVQVTAGYRYLLPAQDTRNFKIQKDRESWIAYYPAAATEDAPDKILHIPIVTPKSPRKAVAAQGQEWTPDVDAKEALLSAARAAAPRANPAGGSRRRTVAPPARSLQRSADDRQQQQQQQQQLPNPAQLDWDEMYGQLCAWHRQYRNCVVPHYVFDAPVLGHWVNYLRRAGRRGRLTPRQQEQLNTLGFEWRLTQGESQWHHLLHELRRFRAVYGHTEAEGFNDLAEPDFVHLGRWLRDMANKFAKGKLSDSKQRLLAQLGVKLKIDPDTVKRYEQLHGLNSAERRAVRQRWKRDRRRRLVKGSLQAIELGVRESELHNVTKGPNMQRWKYERRQRSPRLVLRSTTEGLLRQQQQRQPQQEQAAVNELQPRRRWTHVHGLSQHPTKQTAGDPAAHLRWPMMRRQRQLGALLNFPAGTAAGT